MQHAKLLLEDPNKSIADIGTDLGYLNRKYFTKCFKEEFGITPTEYRNSLKEDCFRGDFLVK